MRSFLLLLVVFVLLVLIPLPQPRIGVFDGPRTPVRDLTLAVTKGVYYEHEPIELNVTFFNSGQDDLEVLVNYPWFGLMPEEPGLIIEPDNKNSRHTHDGKQAIAFRVPNIPIHPGDKWETAVYLQRFVGALKPGMHRLPYELYVPYYRIHHGDEKTLGLFHAKGELVFTVRPAEGQGLEAVLKDYSDRLLNQDYWRRREATEALSVVEDPIVIPHLLTMYTLGEEDYALRALRRFPGNQDAEAAVMTALDSQYRRDVTQALEVLTEWNYLLKASELKGLLDRDDEAIHKATLRYLRTVLGRRFASIPG